MPALSNSVSGGLIPVRQMTGKELGKGNEYEVLAAYGVVILTGDALLAVATSSAVDGTPQVQVWTEGANLVLGASMGAKPTLTNLTLQYHAISTLGRIIVADDPQTIFRIKHDGTSASTDVYAYASIEPTAGSTTTGQSGHLLDSSSISATATTSLPLKIMRGANTLGDTIDNATSGSVVEVMIINHVWNT